MNFAKAFELMLKGEFVKLEDDPKHDIYIAEIEKIEIDHTTGEKKPKAFKMFKQRNLITGDTVHWQKTDLEILSDKWIKSKKEIKEDKK